MNEADRPERLLQLDTALNAFLGRAADAFKDLGEEVAQTQARVEAVVSRLEMLQRETVEGGNALKEQLRALGAWVAEGLRGDAQAQERIATIAAECDMAKAAAEAERARAETLETQLTAEWQAAATLRDQAASLERQLADAQEELGRVRASLDAAPNAEAVASEQARLEARLGQAREALEARTRELAQVRDTLANSVSAAEAAQLREALEARTRELEETRAALDESVSASEAEQLRQAAEKERARAQELEERLRQETSRGTKSVLAEQLAEALRENEVLRDELRRQERPAAESAPPPKGGAPKPTARKLDQSEAARLRQVAASLRDGHKRTIGEILVDAELITTDQLDDALDEQRRNPHTHLGAILAQKGYTSGEAVAQALALQCGVPFIHLDDMGIDRGVARLITGRLARQHHCVPLRFQDNDTLVVALGNPLDLVAIEDIERTTNRRVEVVVAMDEEIQQVIEAHYPTE